MKKIFLLFALILFTSTGLTQWISLDKNSIPDSKLKVQLIKDNASETIIKVDLPGFRLNEFEDNGIAYKSIDIGDLAGKISEAGMPDIPYIAKILAVPNQGTIEAEVLDIGKTQVIEGVNIPPVKERRIEGSPEAPYTENGAVYQSENLFPAVQVKVEDPMVFRDFRIVRLSIFPIRYSPARQQIEALTSITVKIKYGSGKGVNPKLTPDRPIAPSFAKIYKSMIFNYKEVLDREYNGREDGYDIMLCIMPDSFATTFQPYAEWINKTGTYVHITKFSEIGASGGNPVPVKNYILNTYNTWEMPPTHVFLVGDAGVFPVQYITLHGWTFTYDEYFVELEGSDYLPEMFVGRFTHQTNSGLNALIGKLIGYEQDPPINDAAYFRRALVCANNAVTSQRLTKRFTSHEMMEHGNFLSVDSLYNGSPCPGTVATIRNMINEGRGFLNYRGEGWYTGWWASCFPLGVSDINSLNNGRKLTFVTSIGCGVANFEGNSNNFGETWMEIGDGTSPRGACAFVGPVSNTYADYNNEIDKGIYQGMFEERIDVPSEALIHGHLRMLVVFGNGDSYVEYHFKIYHTLGNPAIHIWKDTPKYVNVIYTDTIGTGAGQVNVTVNYEDSGLPVEGAKVCVSGDSVYAVGTTLSDGTLTLNIDPQVTGQLNFSVSGKDVFPFEGTIQVVEGGVLNGWQWIETGYPYTLYDMSFPPGQSDIGYAVGSDTTEHGIILKTEDGGLSWTKISNDTIVGLRTVCFTTTTTGFAGGYQNTMLKTIDGGLTWSSTANKSGSPYISSIRFWNETHGIRVNYPFTVFVTTNGGDNWYFAQGVKQTAEDICFADENTLFMVGGDEMVSRSTDGGINWEHIYSGTPFAKLVGVDFLTPQYGIAGGENGKIIVTTDSGFTWTTSYAGSTGLMRGISIRDNLNSFAAGSPEQVYKSTDGGLSWASDFQGADVVGLYKLIFTERGVGLICGSDGKFLINMDYVIPVELSAFSGSAEGNTAILNWQTATETNNRGFDILRSADGSSWEKIGFVEGAGTKSTTSNYSYRDQQLKAGSYYYKLKQMDFDGSYKYSEKVNIVISMPVKYSLEQNYPNPFNPVTTIRFTIPQEAMVNLTIYNIVGEKVKELKNETMKPGYYQVDFNASNLASGVYFYRLQAGNFTSTKKMNLLK